MSAPHISIILPIFNVENYLEACLASIAKQSFSDFEVLLIDDGSQDKCPEICDRWAREDRRFHVVHKKNGGVGSARNAGLEIARGDFFAFVDPDDYLESDYFAALVEAQARCDADLVIGKFIRLNESGRVIAQSQESRECFIPRSDFSRYLPQLFKDRRLHFVYPKLYRSSSFRSLRFDETMRISEDSVWNADVLTVANSIQLSNNAGYRNIRYDTRGLTKQANLEQFKDHLRAYERIFHTVEEHGWKSEELLRVLDERIILWADGALKAIRRGPWPLKQKAAYASMLCGEPILKSAYAHLEENGCQSFRQQKMRRGDGFCALTALMCEEAKKSARKRIAAFLKGILGVVRGKRIS